ncbi:MAG: NADH:flavin oxidoreductase, partial [Pseudomonadota bacterium]|nr:NADH:flavin oxidoreductase [Pseudomonadota bacterium]
MTKNTYPHIFKPLTVGSLHLNNRAVVAPMTRVSGSPMGNATEIMENHYASFARGGWGLIITEGTYTDEQHSQGYCNQPGIA